MLLSVTQSAYVGESSPEFLLMVVLPIGLWLAGMVALFIILLMRYTFGHWTPEHPNPYDGETMGMPRGMFRGMLTMSLLYVTIVLEVVNVYTLDFEFQISEFLVAFQMMIAFYFGSKVMHHVTSVDKQKTTIIAETQAGISQDTAGTNQETVNETEIPADGVAHFPEEDFKQAAG